MCAGPFSHDANRDGGLMINCRVLAGVLSCVSCWPGLEQTFTCCLTLLFVQIQEKRLFALPKPSWGCFTQSQFLSVCLSVCSCSYLLTWMQSAVAHVFGSCSTAVKLCRTWFLLFMKAAMAARWAAQRENSFQLALRQWGSTAQT